MSRKALLGNTLVASWKVGGAPTASNGRIHATSCSFNVLPGYFEPLKVTLVLKGASKSPF